MGSSHKQLPSRLILLGLLGLSVALACKLPARLAQSLPLPGRATAPGTSVSEQPYAAPSTATPGPGEGLLPYPGQSYPGLATLLPPTSGVETTYPDLETPLVTFEATETAAETSANPLSPPSSEISPTATLESGPYPGLPQTEPPPDLAASPTPSLSPTNDLLATGTGAPYPPLDGSSGSPVSPPGSETAYPGPGDLLGPQATTPTRTLPADGDTPTPTRTLPANGDTPTSTPTIPPAIVEQPSPTATFALPPTVTPTPTRTPFLTPTFTPTPTPTVTPTLPPLPPWAASQLRATNPLSFQRSSGKPQLVMFFAFWSGPSQAMAPLVHGVEAEYNARVNFVYLDIDDPLNRNWMADLGFRMEPHFFLLDPQGAILNQWRGYVAVSQLREAINAALR